MLYIIIIAMTTFRRHAAPLLVLFLISISLASCGLKTGSATPIPQGTATITLTPFVPEPTVTPTTSPTPVPLAAQVNGEGITQEEFQAELKRYQSAANSGTNLATEQSGDANQVVLDDLIDQTLLAQAALENGFALDDTALQARIDQLTSQVGGSPAFEKWMTENGYTLESFKTALKRSLAAAWMRDQIVSAIPETADQTHARQILLYNSDQANSVYALLQSGQDFTTLAKKYDPATGGELGWFPRGYLTEKALEDAAFSLEPGQYSPVIQTPLGYHILLVIERDPSRPLNPNARLILQEQALSSWIEQRRAQSNLQTFLP